MNEPEWSSVGRLMGLDVGDKRIGVAVTDENRVVASPVTTVFRNQQALERFTELIRTYEILAIVAGLPRGMSGREGPQAADVREYADELGNALDLPVRYWDERLTTAQAERTLIESGQRRNRRKLHVDAVAASLMLQNYLDSRNRGP